MKKNRILILLISLLFSLQVLATENPAEEKDVKFIGPLGICVIPAKELSNSKEYILDFNSPKLIQLKIALTILQLRVIEIRNFTEISCAIRYFKEKHDLLDKNEGYSEHQKPQDAQALNTIMSDMAGLLEKIRTNPKYKIDFDTSFLGTGDVSIYASLFPNYLYLVEGFEGDLARKVFTSIILASGRGTVTDQEWQTLFNLFFNLKIEPSQKLKDFLIDKLLNTRGNYNGNFLYYYVRNANEFAYNSMFKKMFEGLSDTTDFFFIHDPRTTDDKVKLVYSSPYLPESFKCSYTKNLSRFFAGKSPKELEGFKSISNPCFKKIFQEYDKFVVPANSCAYIDLKKDDDLKALVSKASDEFKRNWIECRAKCNAGDKCTLVKTDRGDYEFFNSKYSKDFDVYKLMNFQRGFPGDNDLIRYDINPESSCQNNRCGEIVSSCTDSDILKKISMELLNAKLLDCSADEDCFSVPTRLNCSPIAINISTRNFSPVMNDNFMDRRIDKMLQQCGRPRNPSSHLTCIMSQRDARIKTSCVNKLCVITK